MRTYGAVDHNLIGMRVRESRELRGYTQEHLAELADLSVTYVSLVEHGKKKASLDSLLRICNALGVTLDGLLSGLQTTSKSDYQIDAWVILQDCSAEERRFLFEMLKAGRDILRKNNWNLEKKFS